MRLTSPAAFSLPRRLTTLHSALPFDGMAQPGLQAAQVHPVENWRQLVSGHLGRKGGAEKGGQVGHQAVWCSR